MSAFARISALSPADCHQVIGFEEAINNHPFFHRQLALIGLFRNLIEAGLGCGIGEKIGHVPRHLAGMHKSHHFKSLKRGIRFTQGLRPE